MKPFREIQQKIFDIRNCDKYLCQSDETLQILNNQPLDYWKEIITADQKINIQNVPATTPLLCIVGENDWVVGSRHSRETCEYASKLGLSATFTVIPNSDHFFAVAKTKEESLQILANRDFSRIQENNLFLESLVKWLMGIQFQ